ncbi:MAG: hypothetical protein QM796_06410 [Chthoniobacteraceae bacterium]
MRFLIRLLIAVSLLSVLQAGEAPAAPPSFSIAGLTFTRPASWAWVASPSAMRKATLTVHGKEGDADCAFFYFGADQGGDVKSNVERWSGQFTGEEDKSVMAAQDFGANKVTLVKAQGTFTSGMPGGPAAPQANYALLGAIIETAQGKVFIKMTGPKPVIAGCETDFLTLVKAAANPAAAPSPTAN